MPPNTDVEAWPAAKRTTLLGKLATISVVNFTCTAPCDTLTASPSCKPSLVARS